jgi:two-component system nitrogen regulation response regulator GlnG
VRELESAVKYALVHSLGDVVAPQALPGSVRGHAEGTLPDPSQAEDGNLADVQSLVRNLLSTGTSKLSETVHAAVDRVLLEQVLASVGGHQARAAEILGLSRNTLRTRLQQLGLTVEKIVQDESDAAH